MTFAAMTPSVTSGLYASLEPISVPNVELLKMTSAAMTLSVILGLYVFLEPISVSNVEL